VFLVNTNTYTCIYVYTYTYARRDTDRYSNARRNPHP
jgi:hypothetical protein